MAASLRIGEVLNGRYPILGILGEGGMGAVYKASDLNSTRIWAIKEMTENFSTEAERREAVAGFEMEANLLSQLDHPNLPRITHFFAYNGHLYLVMDLVEGETWEKRQNRGRQSISEVLEITWQITDVLNYLHNRPQPVIFRDLKPANVMVTPNGMAKLIDFGIARVFQAEKKTDTRALGTPGYAAPEQYGSGQSDARTDIYALGVMMHQAFTGIDPSVDPFKFEPIPNLVPNFPKALDDIVRKAVALHREERYSSVAEMREALQNLHNDADAYDCLPTCLRTGILPKPTTGSMPPAPQIPVASQKPASSTPPSYGQSERKAQSYGCNLPPPSVKRASPAGQPRVQPRIGNADYNAPIQKAPVSPNVAVPVGNGGNSGNSGCMSWGSMGLLFGISLVPWMGLISILMVWIVVALSPGRRMTMVFCALAVIACSILSTCFGTVAINYFLENLPSQ